MKNIIRFVVVLFLVSSTLLSRELEKVSLQLQWLDQFQFAGYYIAKEKGFYNDVGLHVDIKKFKSDINIIDDVILKTTTYGVGRSSLIINKSNGYNLVLLASILQSSPIVLISKKSSGIDSIKKFKGKRAMFIETIYTISINSMLKSNKINIDDLQLKTNFNQVSQFIDDKTDIISIYKTNELYDLEQKNIPLNIFHPQDYGFDFYSDILYTSKHEIIYHKNRAQNFTKASLKGWEYAFSHIEETVDLILEKYNSQKKTKEALIYEANELKKLAYFNTIKLGKIKKDKIQKIYDIYNVMGLVKKPIDMDEFILRVDDENILYFTKKEKNHLKKLKQITMCIDPSWMPFEMIKDGKHIGISADYFKIFQEKLDIPINLIKTDSWSQSLEFAKNRKCDILSLAMEVESRKKYLNFTTPYFSSPLILVAKIGVPFISNFSTINSKRIGMPKGYALFEILRKKYPNLNIVEVENITDGLKKLLVEKILLILDLPWELDINLKLSL